MKRDAVAQARRVWRRLGVPEEAAREMAEELSADLAEAVADGRTAEEYVGGDVAALARTWAAERGLIRPRQHVGRVLAAALLGALPGGFTALFFVFAPSSRLPAFAFARASSGDNWVVRALSASPTSPEPSLHVSAPVILTLYVLSGCIAYAGSLAAVSAVLRRSGDSHRRQTVRAFAVAIPVIGLVATAAGVALAAALNFQMVAFRPVCLLVLLLLALGVALVRLQVVTRTARPAAPAGAV
ncbi:hypothetical protein [Streptomyces sp. NPDC042319]|uniref:hypothetical protein n=1 Tax=Streptomyces sp. NPDC042319 TaxID=3154332 RepID=UPI0033F72398